MLKGAAFFKMNMKKKFTNEIEKLRKEMENSAKNKGFTDCETVRLSQKLDVLLNKYMKSEKGNFRFHL